MGVTAVTLGSFYTTSAGKTVLGGAGGSGLDTQSLVTALTTAKQAPITQDQSLIKTNDSKSTALTQLQTLLSTFKSAADALRNAPGVNNEANNAFAFTTGDIGNGGSAYVSVTTSPRAALQSYAISDVSSIATAASQGSGTFSFASANADATTGAVRFNPGTITFAGGATVTVNSGDSLNTILANFNAVSSQTGISASIIQVDSSHYAVSFIATSTGTNGSFDLGDAGTVTSGGSVLSNLSLGGAVAGTDAKFKINNVPVERQTNNISDVINNVTFKILGTSPNGIDYPVTVSPDTTTIQNTIVSFVNAYNAIKTFQTQQTQLNSDGTYAADSVLVNDPTFQTIMSDINRNVNSQVAGLGAGALSSLSQIGVTFTNQPATSTTPEVDNILTVNDGQLASALASNFTGVRNLFGFNMTSSNPNFALYSHTLPLGVSDFTVAIDNNAQTYTATYTQNNHSFTTQLTATPLTGGVPGFTLTGAPGSVLAGATFIYASNSSATFTAHATQGIADQVFGTATTALTANTGILPVALKSLKDSDTKLNDDIAKINVQVSAYQQQLIAKFAVLERAISSSNTLLQSINANSNAQLASSGH